LGDFIRERTIVEKRDEICPECKTVIPRGTRYMRESQRERGKTHNAILCEPCKIFADRYVVSMRLCSAINADEETFLYGSLLDEAAEFLGYDVPEGQKRPESREAMLTLFDAFDAAERAERAREREQARAARERRDTRVEQSADLIPGARGMA
jgi:hypothetical protein